MGPYTPWLFFYGLICVADVCLDSEIEQDDGVLAQFDGDGRLLAIGRGSAGALKMGTARLDASGKVSSSMWHGCVLQCNAVGIA